MDLEITKNYIHENLLTKSGKLNPQKVKFTNKTPEEIYLIYNNLKEIPKCYCGNYLKFISFKKGYSKHCSNKCSNKDKKTIKKIKETFKKKYGVDNPSKAEEVKEKKRITTLKNYGVDNPLKSKDIREKGKETSIKKYGTDIPAKSNIIKNKTKENNLKKYGVEYTVQQHLLNFNNLNKEYILEHFIDSEGYPDMEKMIDFYNISMIGVYKFLKRNKIKYKKLSNTSRAEREILEFIGSGEQSDNKLIGKELDILVPEHKFAVEYNGLLWHSWNPYKFPTINKEENKNKHLDKTEMCETKGYQLFHIFEHEWLNPIKKEIWKSIINLKMDRGIRKINFNDCSYKIINEETKKSFLENNCLEGNIKSTINIGLYYGDELVQVLAYSNQYSILSTKINTKIIEGSVINYLKENYNDIKIKLNRRYNTAINTNITKTPPERFFVNIKNMTITKPNNLEEDDILLSKGYRRLYDSGYLILN